MTALEDAVEVPAEPDHDGVCSGGGDRRLLLGTQGASQARGAKRRSDEPSDTPAATSTRRPRGEQRQGLHSGLLKYVRN